MKVLQLNNNVNPDDQSWAKQITAMCEERDIHIPILKRVPKDQNQVRVSFFMPKTVANISEAIIYDNRYYKTKTEFLRAAHYVGVMLLYHLNQEHSDIAETLRKMLEATESVSRKAVGVDDYVEWCSKMVNNMNNGLMDRAQFDQAIDGVIETYPEGMRDVLYQKTKELLMGSRRSDVLLCHVQGGKRT